MLSMCIRGSWNPGQEPPHKIAASTSRLVDRIKKFLSATAGHPIRLRHIADAVGASPTYISRTFHQVEGLTLHEYLQRLRLTRALAELPHADDFTTLALVKQGDPETARRVYSNAKLSKTYQTWPFKNILEERIVQADENIVRFRSVVDDHPGQAGREHQPERIRTMMISSTFACMGCHQR